MDLNSDTTLSLWPRALKITEDHKNIIFNIITKFQFNIITILELTNCKLVDESIKVLDKLFTINLSKLDLSENNIQDIKIFAENDKLINLKELNLNRNEISNISYLSNCKLNNLVDLKLCFNKIQDINFLELNTGLDNLEKLDLSNNLITKLIKINLKKIKYLYLLDNNIIDGIDEFNQSIINKSPSLILEKLKNNSCMFNYYGELTTEFEYFIKENKNITQSLKEISFNGLNNLKLKGFDDGNIKFLSNDSLKNLKVLDIKENSLKNISIFENINLPELTKIKVDNNYFEDNSLVNLNVFPSIKIESIKINRNRINIKYINPE